jgi:anthranilate phosphoribosyltransferase
MIAKHGNRAQTSLSGSADVLMSLSPKAPKLSNPTSENLAQAYDQTNYTFLFAQNFHPGMKHTALVRRELGLRTIFNLMGPLANPVDWALEARLVGVAYQELGPIFAAALRLSGATKALVVCGAEDLDEISCAGKTNCWMLREVPNKQFRGSAREEGEDDVTSDDAESEFRCELETFQLQPSDFGLPSHPLSEVGGGKLPKDDPILHFVLMNTAALLVISGVLDGDGGEEAIKERGPGGGMWKEGVRKARWCIESGRALQELEKFIDFTNHM